MLNGSIKWIMLVSGVLTCTMAHAALAPHAMLQSTFGETVDGPLAELIARNWGALIFLIGGMLIYGAFHPEVRALVLVVAGSSKVVFIALVLSNGGRYIAGQAGISIAVDAFMVLAFAVYLVSRRQPAGMTGSLQGPGGGV
jgi:predicted permease